MAIGGGVLNDDDTQWGDRKFRIEPGFKAVTGTKKEEGGLIGRGKSGVRQYYTGINKETGEITVYRAGLAGQDDPIGTYKKDGSFEPATGRGNPPKTFGTKTELSYFSDEENSKKIKRLSEKIATDQWKEEGKPTPPGDPYEKIYGVERPVEGDENFEDSIREGDSILDSEKAKTLDRKKYSTTLEFPTGITDFAQDKLRISVLKFEPAEVEGDLYVDKIKVNRKFLGQKTISETKIEGGSPFKASKSPLSDRKPIGSVVLPIPDGVTDANAVIYGEDKMNPLQLAGSNIALKTLLDSGKMDGGDAFATTLRTASESGDVPDALTNLLIGSAIGKDASNLLARTSGKVFNNNLQLLFSGPTLRPFNFSYVLSPRDEKESNNVKRIIRMFKQSMAVQQDNVGIYLHAPNTYRLEFLNAVLLEHEFLPRIKECVLKGFEVNYMPTNSYMTYDDTSMVQYQLTFAFQEIDPIFNNDYGNIEGIDSADTEIGF